MSLTIGYRAAAADLLARPAPPPVSGLSVRVEHDIAAERLRELNPDFRGARSADLVAIAEAGARLVGYWAFTVQGDGLIDAGVHVAPDWRGRRVAALLLRAALEAQPSTLVFARTDVRNRGSRRMLRRAGLRPHRLTGAVTLPGLGRFSLGWSRDA